MDMGSGIFSGSLVIGIVVLYIFTRDRWKWACIVRRVAISAVVVVCVVSAGIWGKNEYDNRIVPMNEFMSVKLSDSPAEIKFKKGEPVDDNDDFWLYADSTKNLETVVKFMDGHVKMVSYGGSCNYCNQVFGLGIGTTYEQITEKLGEPSHIDTSKNSLKRIASYERSRLVFHMAEGKVIAFGIYNPKYGPVVFRSGSDK